MAGVINSFENNVKILNLSFVNMKHRPKGSPDTLAQIPGLGPDRNYSICCYFDIAHQQTLEQDAPSQKASSVSLTMVSINMMVSTCYESSLINQEDLFQCFISNPLTHWPHTSGEYNMISHTWSRGQKSKWRKPTWGEHLLLGLPLALAPSPLPHPAGSQSQ